MGAEKQERDNTADITAGFAKIGGNQLLAALAMIRETAKAIQVAAEAVENGEPADESESEGDCGDEDDDEYADENEPDGDEESAQWRAARRRAGRQEWLADDGSFGEFGARERDEECEL